MPTKYSGLTNFLWLVILTGAASVKWAKAINYALSALSTPLIFYIFFLFYLYRTWNLTIVRFGQRINFDNWFLAKKEKLFERNNRQKQSIYRYVGDSLICTKMVYWLSFLVQHAPIKHFFYIYRSGEEEEEERGDGGRNVP